MANVLTHLILGCDTLGKKVGDMIEVGEKEGQILLSDAKVLIDEKMAKAFEPTFVNNAETIVGNAATKAKFAELKDQVSTLTVENENLKAQLEMLTDENKKG